MVKHDTLLVCSPDPEVRQDLRKVFLGTFHLLEAGNINQLLLLLRQNSNCVAALLLDITDLDKIDVPALHQEENKALLSRVPVIILSEEESPDVLNRAFSFGAADVISLNYDPYAMLKRAENIVDLHLHKQHLEAMVEHQKALLRHTSDAMVDTLSSIIEYRSAESGQHILRIRHFTKILLEEVARSCPEYKLDPQTIAIICSASALHDIGKIAIPDAILMKPGALTKEEREVMQTHALTGCRILDTLENIADKEYLRYAHNICHYHHERWDGGGYPEGLRGDAIPICAQVVGLADAYDALTSRRVYKDAYSAATAVHMIVRGACGVFSPKLLECFQQVHREWEDLAKAYADGMSPRKESFDTALPMPEEAAENTLERIQGKYFALVHHINGLLIELDLDRKVFRLVYNPYPELASFEEMNSLEEVQNILLNRFTHPSQRGQMEDFLNIEIPRFLMDGRRRARYHFRASSDMDPRGEQFELTLMRINPLDTGRRTLAVLAQKLESERTEQTPAGEPDAFLECTYSCCNDRDFTLLEAGSQTVSLAGYSLAEIREGFGGRLLELAHPEDREMIRREFARQLKTGTQVCLEYRVVYRDGTVHWIYNKSRLAVDKTGREVLYSFLIDINKLRHNSDAMLEKLRRYEIILAQTENVLFEWDLQQDTITFSDTWEKIFGYAPDRQIIQSGSFLHPDDLPKLIDKVNALECGSAYEMAEVRVSTAAGRYLWCRFRATAIRDHRGSLQKISGIVINIDAEKQAEQVLQSRAEQDPLTGLLNKDAARKQAEAYFARYPQGVSCTLLIIDLDNFKQVNDRYGHLFGDTVLTQAAREIKRLFRSQDIVARIGGDEFMVLMRGISDDILLEQRCRNLIQAFRGTFRNQRYELPLSCSIGAALSPAHGQSYFELFQRADQALYRAKAKGKNCFVLYDPEDTAYLSQPGRTGAVATPIDSDTEPGLANSNLVRYAFRKLYSSQNTETSVQEILGFVGQKLNVSRVYVFENSEDNRYCSNTFEWCNEGIPAEIDNLKNISYDRDIPGYADNFDENGIFYCPDVSLLPPNVYAILAPQGIKSMLQCAIREDGVFRGYIGFDECRELRLWTNEQIELLNFLSESLSMFLLRLRRQEKVQQQVEELCSILDNQDAWIYIVEPESFRLQYVNRKLAGEVPGPEAEVPCYRALKGRDTPCTNCPAAGLRSGTGTSHLEYLSAPGCLVLMEAARIRWNGREAWLMTGRKLPGLVASE